MVLKELSMGLYNHIVTKILYHKVHQVYYTKNSEKIKEENVVILFLSDLCVISSEYFVVKILILNN